ncbi:hypothetical protein HNY73_010088 [Argiope bruennichi]|uniref:Uncharacterized protein n=1 Tax=Argiope bruennichi TaxID=94029 RepID=A0A8T0F4T3_ARGBR|nr:hypothetical protein HNY73_010088 [Argiope bruennichi]
MPDGATSHTKRRVKNVIQAHFPSGVLYHFLTSKITRSESFWLLAVALFKDRNYQGNVTNEALLKASIIHLVSSIPTGTLFAFLQKSVLGSNQNC